MTGKYVDGCPLSNIYAELMLVTVAAAPVPEGVAWAAFQLDESVHTITITPAD